MVGETVALVEVEVVGKAEVAVEEAEEAQARKIFEEAQRQNIGFVRRLGSDSDSEGGGGGGGGSDKPVVGKFILGIGPANFFPSADEAEGQESSSQLQPGGGRAAAEAFLRCCPPDVASEVNQEILRSREGELPAALGGGIMTIKC